MKVFSKSLKTVVLGSLILIPLASHAAPITCPDIGYVNAHIQQDAETGYWVLSTSDLGKLSNEGEWQGASTDKPTIQSFTEVHITTLLFRGPTLCEYTANADSHGFTGFTLMVLNHSVYMGSGNNWKNPVNKPNKFWCKPDSNNPAECVFQVDIHT